MVPLSDRRPGGDWRDRSADSWSFGIRGSIAGGVHAGTRPVAPRHIGRLAGNTAGFARRQPIGGMGKIEGRTQMTASATYRAAARVFTAPRAHRSGEHTPELAS